MVRLIPMTDAQFQEFLAVSVPDYAAEMVVAGNWPAQGAEERARAEFRELLAHGLNTPNNYLWRIVDERSGEAVGHLWLCVREEGRRGFVYDVEVYERFRRRGYGRQAFLAMEEIARDLGLIAIGLHVFAHNAPARALYQDLGFTERGIMMAKEIDRR